MPGEAMLAAGLTNDPELLEWFSNHELRGPRWIVVKNPATPEWIIEKLTHDPELLVAGLAKRRLGDLRPWDAEFIASCNLGS